LERAKGIEPSYAAWEAAVLPLNYARVIYTLNQLLRYDYELFFPIKFGANLVAGCADGTNLSYPAVSATGFPSGTLNHIDDDVDLQHECEGWRSNARNARQSSALI
jgi:hypothetical protein